MSPLEAIRRGAASWPGRRTGCGHLCDCLLTGDAAVEEGGKGGIGHVSGRPFAVQRVWPSPGLPQRSRWQARPGRQSWAFLRRGQPGRWLSRRPRVLQRAGRPQRRCRLIRCIVHGLARPCQRSHRPIAAIRLIVGVVASLPDPLAATNAAAVGVSRRQFLTSNQTSIHDHEPALDHGNPGAPPPAPSSVITRQT